jgi:hypothetical protein
VEVVVEVLMVVVMVEEQTVEVVVEEIVDMVTMGGEAIVDIMGGEATEVLGGCVPTNARILGKKKEDVMKIIFKKELAEIMIQILV